MQASISGFISDFFWHKIQYQIPVYQRNYDWGTKECKELYDDIMNAIKDNKKHFLGTFVQYKLDPENNIKDIDTYIIIDGQQRYTTVYLFLKAIYDLINDSHTKDELNHYLFNECSITGYKYELNEKLKLKLKAVKSDDKQLKLLMKDNLELINKDSNIYKNYAYFKDLIKKQINNNFKIQQYIYGLKLLEVNCIELNINKGDDPQIIFDRINSTGKPLDLKDKVRNYLLMNENDMDKLFETYWEPMETLLKVENVNGFISSYFLYKITDPITKKLDYYAFKKYAINKNNEDILKELLHLSKYYHAFINYDKSYGKEINEILNYFRLLKQGTIYVLFYDLFKDYDNEIITHETLIKTLNFFLNYSIRRLITGVKSGSLRGFYKSLYKRVFNNEALKTNDNYYNAIINFMCKQYTSDRVPSDEQFLEKLKEIPIYRQRNLARILLCICENGFNEKELIHISDDITIEHIMPQNKKNKWWKEHIGDSFDYTYALYIDTIGNLTLSGQNSELSDKPFNEKTIMLRKNSKFKILNEDIINQSVWREEQIINRAINISKIIIDKLSLPDIFSNTRFNNADNITAHTLYDNYDYRYKKIVYFTFQKKSIVVNSFRDFQIKFLEILYKIDKSCFENFIKEDFIHFNTIDEEKTNKKLNSYKIILDTNIVVETNFSHNDIIKFLRKAYGYYDFSPEELLFYTES